MQEENDTAANNATDTRSADEIFVPVLFSVIIVVGTIGNTLLVYVVLRWREMRTPCNYLIVNNAIADLGVAIIAAPLRIVEVYQGWVLGEAVCQILAPTQDTFAVVSVITYTLIAFERYRAVMSPFKPKLSSRSILIVVVITWALTYLSAGLPIALLLRLVKVAGKFYCKAAFASVTSRQIYKVYLVVVFLVIPLALQTLAYSRLVHRLKVKDSLQRSFSDARSSHRRRIRKQRLIRVTIILIIFFHICFIPRMTAMLIYEFAPDFTKNAYFKHVNLVILALYYVRHVINPLILFSVSTHFRRRFPFKVCHLRGNFLRVFSSRRSTLNSKLTEAPDKGNGEDGEMVHWESTL